MISIIILGLSISVQILAAVLAIRLIKITQTQLAWVLVAIAVLLMAIRRSVTLYFLLFTNSVSTPNLEVEILALIISVFMASGIALIRPIFVSIQNSKKSSLESEQNLKSMAESSSDGILVVEDNKVLFANSKAFEILEKNNFRLNNKITTSKNIIWPITNTSPNINKFNILANKNYKPITTSNDDGSLHAEIVTTETLWSGASAELISIRNITDRFVNESKMKKLSSALEQTADSVVITDAKGVIEYVNPAFEKTTGYSRDEAIGKTPKIVKSNKHQRDFYVKLWDKILQGEVYRDIFINKKKGGAIFYEEKTITPLLDSNQNIVNFISTGKDVTERIQTEEKLHFLAYHDVLTELPNRALFLERIEHAISRHRSERQNFTVLFLDVDNFKNVNDTLGHDIGDTVLIQISNKLSSCIRKGDTLARFGGDEFGILLNELAEENVISKISDKILTQLSKPIKVKQNEIYLSASIGICTFPTDGNNANVLLKNADTAMYKAKELGRNNFQFYSRSMGDIALRRMEIETELRHALEKDEFELYYQPQIDIQTGQIVGAEALLRWNHSKLGVLTPDTFIPILEETGLIISIGEWVIKQACKQIKIWNTIDSSPDFSISVNVSAVQFQESGLIDVIKETLNNSNLDPNLLELEITESILMENMNQVQEIIGKISLLGVKFAIDDFGTGYSSLSYLQKFKIDTLKIDKSFIHDINKNEDNATIVKTIIAMAHALKLSIIAEGVETIEQESFLKDSCCVKAQGYYYSRPVPVEQFTKHLKSIGN